MVAYVPRYPSDDLKARYNTMDANVQIVLLVTNSFSIVLPLQTIERTTLSKMSRSMHNRQCEAQPTINAKLIIRYQRLVYTPLSNNPEQTILDELTGALSLLHTAVGIESDMFEMRLSCMILIKLQHRLQEGLRLSNKFPLATTMTHLTVRNIGIAW